MEHRIGKVHVLHHQLCPIVVLVLFLAGCESRTDLAPVAELRWRAPAHHATKHIVRPGETLYALAFRYDKDYRQLAALNRLRNPYILYVGQVIQLDDHIIEKPARSRFNMQSMTIDKAKPAIPSNQSRAFKSYPINDTYHAWSWPVNGRVATSFIPSQGKKGIDIAGEKGSKVRAAATGIVAYAGNGLLGYGNLIIIKHSNQYLTAYGNNFRNLVHEGQPVKVGQVIAEIGVIDRRYWGVHFEIRKAGRPVNPLTYLPRGG